VRGNGDERVQIGQRGLLHWSILLTNSCKEKWIIKPMRTLYHVGSVNMKGHGDG
jgi:hypothetical protein